MKTLSQAIKALGFGFCIQKVALDECEFKGEWAGSKGANHWKCDIMTGDNIYSFEYHTGAMAGEPQLNDCINSLLLDSQAIDETFENWCGDFGYSTDSIKALKLYDRCIEIGKGFVYFLGKATWEELRYCENDL